MNLKALDSRLRTTFSHICRSTNTASASGGQSTVSRQPGLLAGRAEVAGEVGGEGGEVGRLVGRPHPPGLDPGEVQQGVDEPLEPQPVAVDDLQPLPLGRRQRPSVSARASSTGPSISVSGVRNSWLTFEKKAVLARSSSASASARRRSSS